MVKSRQAEGCIALFSFAFIDSGASTGKCFFMYLKQRVSNAIKKSQELFIFQINISEDVMHCRLRSIKFVRLKPETLTVLPSSDKKTTRK